MHQAATTTLESIALNLGLAKNHLEFYGPNKAKISLDALASPPRNGKLILVSAITPTPAGEGKTTVSIGLAQGLQQSGRLAALALRQPSMGPVFGRKGGATGGGQSSLTPMEDLNLHFTGDFHAITSAHNLLAAAIDNRLHFKTTRLDPLRVTWKRVLDMNDRALRSIRVSLGSKVERDTGFDITAASEVMAILCMAQSYEELRERLDRIIVGFTVDDEPVEAREMGVTGSMLALLKDALKPNFVRSLEGVPAFVHGGPFANIAHGCNSILATRLALGYADYAVTEAGFAFDLGGEKFLDLKCHQAGIAPAAIVLVATLRALKMHGGVALADLTQPSPEDVEKGLENLAAHIDAARSFERPVVVAINRFPDDTEEEENVVKAFCDAQGIPCALADIFAKGGLGGLELAECVVKAAETPSPSLKRVYELDDPIGKKIEAIARRIYGADGVNFTDVARAQLAEIEGQGFGKLPICMAKTQESLSDDRKLLGRPSGFRITVRGFEIANGAGFIVALTGTMMRMPALPKVPAAERIDLDADESIVGW